MKLNDITKGVLLCVGLVILIAIAGTFDYQDEIYYQRDNTPEQVMPVDTTESAYDVMRYVQAIDNSRPQ